MGVINDANGSIDGQPRHSLSVAFGLQLLSSRPAFCSDILNVTRDFVWRRLLRWLERLTFFVSCRGVSHGLASRCRRYCFRYLRV